MFLYIPLKDCSARGYVKLDFTFVASLLFYLIVFNIYLNIFIEIVVMLGSKTKIVFGL